jgi:hypothetical protein
LQKLLPSLPSNFTEITFYGAGPNAYELSQELIKNVVDCIRHCLLHDADNLVSKEIFTVLMQPLVDQVFFGLIAFTR